MTPESWENIEWGRFDNHGTDSEQSQEGFDTEVMHLDVNRESCNEVSHNVIV